MNRPSSKEVYVGSLPKHPKHDRAAPFRRVVLIAAVALSVILTMLKGAQSGWIETLHFFQYVSPPIIFAAALLCDRINARRSAFFSLVSLDLIAIAIAASRLITTATPFSGHMVLFTYGLLSSRDFKIKIFAVVLLIHTSVLKLFVWSDSATWACGALIGLLLGIVARSRAAEQIDSV